MSVLKTALAWILSIILGLTLITIFMIGNVSSFFTVSSMEKTVSNIDVTHEMEKIKNSTATSGNKAELSEMIDLAYDEAESHGISTKLVDEIFNSNEIKKFLGKAVGNTTDFIINGAKEQKVTSEDFNKLLDDNMDKWIKNSGVEISDSKKEVLLIRIKNASAGFINTLPTSETISNKLNSNTVDMVQFLFSSKVKTSLVVLVIVSMALLLLLKRKNYKWLLYIAIPSVIVGLTTIGISFVIVDALTLALTNYDLSFMISALSSTLSHNILITGLIAIIISIILFIAYGLLSKKKEMKKA